MFFFQYTFASNKTLITNEKTKLLIGYYGRPNTSSLGILGQSSIDELILKMKEKAKLYKKELNGNVDIQLAFHLIYAMATIDSGNNKNHILKLKHETVMKYINRAIKEGFAVIIDLQLGIYTPYEAIKPVLKYLNYENVHLAVDPEFKIPKHIKYPPRKILRFYFSIWFK